MPRVGLQCCMIDLFLVFKETSILFSIVAVSIYIPTNNAGEFPSLHTFSGIYCLWIFFDDNHFDRCEVLSHCGFDLHFSNT